jgi:DNA-binding MarR family transcriptional regulator
MATPKRNLGTPRPSAASSEEERNSILVASYIIRIAELMNRRVNRMFVSNPELKVIDVRLILNLAEDDARTIGELSRRTRIDKAWTSRSLRRLETMKLVARDRGADARAGKLFRLTNEGMALRRQILPRLTAFWKQAASGIDARLAAGMLSLILSNLSNTDTVEEMEAENAPASPFDPDS